MTTTTTGRAAEANATLARTFFEEQDRLRGGPAPALCAPGYQAHIGGIPAMTREGHEAFAKAFYAAFPDMRHEIDQVFATEDRAFVRFILHGTNSESFFGMPATGRRVTVPAHIAVHVSGGQVTALYGVFDEAGMLRQLGILPSS